MILSAAFKKASTKIWTELTPIDPDSNDVIFEIREEGLTSMLLKQLKFSKCKAISSIKMIPPAMEQLKGYDFQMSFGNDKDREYVNFFIQAKRLNGHEIKSKYSTINTTQTKNLIEYSKRKGIPLYAFYNHLTENNKLLHDYYDSITSFNKKCLGVTLASAQVVDTATSYEFSTLHKGEGKKLPRSSISPRELASVFNYYKNKSNMAVPFHELSYFRISVAKKINELYKKNKKTTLPLLLLLLIPGLDDFLYGNNDLIPIIKTDSQEIISSFLGNSSINRETYFPRALIIINTD